MLPKIIQGYLIIPNQKKSGWLKNRLSAPLDITKINGIRLFLKSFCLDHQVYQAN